MLLKQSRGLHKSMRQMLGGLKPLKRLCPAVLPVQRQPGENGNRRKNSEQSTVSQSMQSPHNRGPSGDASCRERPLNQR